MKDTKTSLIIAPFQLNACIKLHALLTLKLKRFAKRNTQLIVYILIGFALIILSHLVRDLKVALRTFARKFSNIDFFLKILSLKDDELVMSEM